MFGCWIVLKCAARYSTMMVGSPSVCRWPKLCRRAGWLRPRPRLLYPTRPPVKLLHSAFKLPGWKPALRAWKHFVASSAGCLSPKKSTSIVARSVFSCRARILLIIYIQSEASWHFQNGAVLVLRKQNIQFVSRTKMLKSHSRTWNSSVEGNHNRNTDRLCYS